METKRRVATGVLILLCAVSASIGAFAQRPYYSKSNHFQIRSMECGEWNFHPGWWYVSLHKGYSGGKWTWSLHIKFDVKRSNVGQCSGPRHAQIPLEESAKKAVQRQIDSISPIVKEEVIRAAERRADLIYPMFKSDFDDLGKVIKDNLTYIYQKSSGKMSEACLEITFEYDKICSQIEYIHKQGEGHEIEPAKRQMAYEDARKQMTDLAKSTSRIALYTSTKYDK